MQEVATEIKFFLAIIIGTVVLIGGAAMLLGKSSPTDTSGLVRNNSHFVGSPNAKVTVVEFSDFECPACKAAQPTVTAVLQKYKDKIRFVYRNFPLPSHEFGMIAAQAAEAAGLQNKFWEMHDKLFEKSPDLSKDKLITYAAEIGLDSAKFNADLDSDAVRQIVLDNQADGNKAGLSVTPTFFINGTKFDGGMSLDQFSKEIEARLN